MNVNYSFLLTIISGLSTLIGYIIILFKFKNINKIIVFSLSFSSGIMFCISIFELLSESIKNISKTYNTSVSIIIFLIFFVIGVLLSKIIDKIIPENNNLYKTGLISMIAIVLHNIPEGILTFMASNINKKLGLSLAFSISMHNIPEGVSISVPIYYSTNNKLKTLVYTLIASFSEIFGALITYLFLKKLINSLSIGILLSMICGIMIYISIFNLLKEAKKYNNKLYSTYFMVGIIFMLINLIIF